MNLKFTKTAATAHRDSAMEAETMKKNVASLKCHTSKGNLKKLFLLLACCLAVVCARATVFPSDWEITALPWTIYDKAPSGFARNTAEASYFGAYYNFNALDVNEFEDAWSKIPNEYPLTKAVMRGDPSPSPKPNDFLSASFKVGYDDTGFFVFVVYEDDEYATWYEFCEIVYSPYYKLETGGRNFTVGGEDRSGILYTRYWELGASKIVVKRTGVFSVMKLSGYGVCYDMPPNDCAHLNYEFADCTDPFNENRYCWAIKIPYNALDDTYYGTPFNKEVWTNAGEGNGISFDVKFADNDSDLGQYSFRDYWWNADDNNGFWSTDWAGFLKPGASVASTTGTGVDWPANYTYTPQPGCWFSSPSFAG